MNGRDSFIKREKLRAGDANVHSRLSAYKNMGDFFVD